MGPGGNEDRPLGPGPTSRDAQIMPSAALVAAQLAEDGDDPGVNELMVLAGRLTVANESITSLRALLATLRERRAEVRTAA